MGACKCFLLLIFLYSNFYLEVESKVYNRCEFVWRLQSLGVPRDQLGSWTCIANYESHFNTKAVNPTSTGFGILQISDPWWCSKTNGPGGLCDLICGELLGDDIRDDIECARHMYRVNKKQFGNGFSAWTVWRTHCSGNNDRWIEDCL